MLIFGLLLWSCFPGSSVSSLIFCQLLGSQAKCSGIPNVHQLIIWGIEIWYHQILGNWLQRDLSRFIAGHLTQSWTPASQQKLARGIKSLAELGDMVTAKWSACLPVSAGVLAR